jgi:hypothetical protein
MKISIQRVRGAAIGLALLLGACPPADPVVNIGMTDSTFVKTMVRLRKVNADSTIDSLGKDSARKMVLRQQGVTVAKLDTAAKLLSIQPARAESIWKAIEEGVHPRPAAPPAPKPSP